MPKTIQNRREALAWQKHHDDTAPKVGDAAPDFELSDVHGENTIRLSYFRGKKPVALIFGSYT
jgi:peroxiredoxin